MKKEIDIYSGATATIKKIFSCDRKVSKWEDKRDLRLKELRDIVKTNIQSLITDPVHKNFFSVETLGARSLKDFDKSFLQEIVNHLAFRNGKLEYDGSYTTFNFDKEVLEKSGFHFTERKARELAASISTALKGVMVVEFSNIFDSKPVDLVQIIFKVDLIIE